MFEFRKDHVCWIHDKESYDDESLLRHYQEFHLGETTSGRILPECLVVYRKMSEKINSIRDEFLTTQKEREEFFLAREGVNF